MKKLNRSFYLSLCTLLLASTSVIALPKLNIVTEFMPPLQLAKSGHKIHGKTAELVSAIVEDSGLLHHIDIFPWARSYLWATTKPNVLIFPIIRTEEREHKFHWIGKVWSFSAQVYRLKSRSDIKANSLEDAKNYSVGVYREDFFHRYLVRQGFKSEQLYAVTDIEQSVLLFLHGRTDLIVIDESILEYYLKKHHHTNSEVFSIMQLPDVKANDAYIALSKGTSPAIINQLTQSYQRVSTSESFADDIKRRTVSSNANTQ
ncbi:substrate-binding periplasmic protein [Psychrobium sp. nBUS_13]|uniref:substrate-binding periplasmic protein n=1 Tax=Psychrobium sp. nBUS_13 TaxID=3395319 RepID=UPI003EC14B80